MVVGYAHMRRCFGLGPPFPRLGPYSRRGWRPGTVPCACMPRGEALLRCPSGMQCGAMRSHGPPVGYGEACMRVGKHAASDDVPALEDRFGNGRSETRAQTWLCPAFRASQLVCMLAHAPATDGQRRFRMQMTCTNSAPPEPRPGVARAGCATRDAQNRQGWPKVPIPEALGSLSTWGLWGEGDVSKASLPVLPDRAMF